MENFEVKSHYAKDKTVKVVRHMTLDEAKALHYGQHVVVLSDKGTWTNAKVNGQPKTWKRDSNRCEVPLKYGMYEYFTECFSEGKTTTGLVVEIA